MVARVLEMTSEGRSANNLSSGSQSKGKDGIDELLERLHLEGEEDQDIKLEGVFDDLKAGARWTAIVKVFTSKPFNQSSFISTMNFASQPA